MKVRNFNVLNYNIKYAVEQFFINKINIEPVGLVSAKVKNNYSLNIFINNEPIKYGKAEKLFNSLNKEAKEFVINFYKKQYKEKQKQTIEKYNNIKKQTDFIFFDDKEYKDLLNVLENALYCQSTSALKDFMDKKLRSKATKNIKYLIRNQEYLNISCD